VPPHYPNCRAGSANEGDECDNYHHAGSSIIAESNALLTHQVLDAFDAAEFLQYCLASGFRSNPSLTPALGHFFDVGLKFVVQVRFHLLAAEEILPKADHL